MKYLKKFDNHAAYDVAKDGLILPNVSLCVNENEVHYNPYVAPDPYAGHDYVEIGGVKWATMNIGANSITDAGLYFQWGDTSGYTAAQVGCENGKKCFDSDTWSDYKYGLIDLDDEDNYGMTKYNSTDGKTVLEASDDAAQANWGGQWRMPTTDECVALGEAVTTAWTNDYQSTGVKGLVCTSKADGATLFFPAAGYCEDGAVSNVGSNGYYWSSSLNNGDAYYARYLYFNSGRMNNIYDCRNRGFSVRGVVGQ